MNILTTPLWHFARLSIAHSRSIVYLLFVSAMTTNVNRCADGSTFIEWKCDDAAASAQEQRSAPFWIKGPINYDEMAYVYFLNVFSNL